MRKQIKYRVKALHRKVYQFLKIRWQEEKSERLYVKPSGVLAEKPKFLQKDNASDLEIIGIGEKGWLLEVPAWISAIVNAILNRNKEDK